MRRVVLFSVVVACSGGGGIGDSGGNGSPPADAPSQTGFCNNTGLPASPLCSTTCGNGVIDSCYDDELDGEGCPMPYGRTEVCDGSNPSCAQLGYYGGTTECDDECAILDERSCDACAPGALACGPIPLFDGSVGIAVSGSNVALASTMAVQIYNGLTAGSTVSISNVVGIVGVTDGWLVATMTNDDAVSLTPLGSDGALGATRSLVLPGAPPSMSFGPGDLVLATWTSSSGAVTTMLVDASGDAVGPASTVFFGGGSPSVTTDGNSFFVASTGMLATIGSDGATSISGGFPVATGSASFTTATWNADVGWYVARVSGVVMAQRFDATGAAIGAAVPIAGSNSVAFIAGGSDLLALSESGSNIYVAPFDATGSAAAPIEVGVASYGSVAIAGFGSGLVVKWDRIESAAFLGGMTESQLAYLP